VRERGKIKGEREMNRQTGRHNERTVVYFRSRNAMYLCASERKWGVKRAIIKESDVIAKGAIDGYTCIHLYIYMCVYVCMYAAFLRSF
jgi:hypothetical protein